MDAIVIDDTDSRLTYSTDWLQLADVPRARNQTTHKTCTAGSWLQLSFHGTSLSVIGTASRRARDEQPSVLFMVDNTTYSPTAPFLRGNLKQALTYTTPELDLREHVLLVQFNSTTDALPEDLPSCYEFDYLVYTSGFTSNQQNLVDPLTDAPPRSHIRVGVILSISAACLLLLEVALALLLFRWYRKRKRQTHLLRTRVELPKDTVTAFDAGDTTLDSKISILEDDRPPTPGSERSLEVFPPSSPRQEEPAVAPRRKSNVFRPSGRDLANHPTLESVTEESERGDGESDSLSYLDAGSAEKVQRIA